MHLGVVGSQCGFRDHVRKRLAQALQRHDVFEGEVGHYFAEELKRELEEGRGHHLSLWWLDE